MIRSAVAIALALGTAGCASIFNGQTQSISVQSVPEGATVSVTNRAGQKIHSGTAPVTLTLQRGAGYFKSETYTIAFAKDGYIAREVVVSGNVSGWYIGNLLFGGLIGMLAVDPATGAMYVFPETVSESLEPIVKTSQGAPVLKVISTDALTVQQLSLGRPLVAANQQ